MRKSGFSFNKVAEGLYFVLSFSSSDEGLDKRILGLGKELVGRGQNRGIHSSVSIHSELFVNKISFLKNVSSQAKKMLNFAKSGDIIVSKSILENLDLGYSPRPKHVEIGDEIMEIYTLD